MGPTGPTGGGWSEQTSPVVTWSSGGSPTIDLPEMTIVGSVSSAGRVAEGSRAANGGGTTSVPASGANGEVQEHSVAPLNGASQAQASPVAGLAVDRAAQSGADAGVSSSAAAQARSAPSADEGGIIAGGQAMSVQAAQSHSPQGAGGGPSMGAMRSGLEAASWIPGPIGSVAAATLVGIDIYQGNYGQAALGVLGIFGGRAMTSGVRAVRDTKIVTAALEGLSGAGAKLGNAFAGWAKGGAKLSRFHGPKPGYSVNPAHVSGRGLRPGKTPLPKDAEETFRNAIPNDATNPTAWFARSSEGQIYRYSVGGDGTAHFSGIHGVGDGTRNMTRYALERLGGL